ncbi:MAG: acetyltransferase [Candidatus Thermoplasmatota archaeon]
MTQSSPRKQELDRKRTEWRKKHRTLNGRIILYPAKKPEHINARGSKLYNWFWHKILLEAETQDIPAIISALQDAMKGENDLKKQQIYRTMIGMADDAYQLKKLEDIQDYDPELLIGKKPVYNSEEGIIYKNGQIYTTDYTEDESEIILRDIEGIIIDALSSETTDENQVSSKRELLYKDWEYTKNQAFANK